jgi:hypothetical protein
VYGNELAKVSAARCGFHHQRQAFIPEHQRRFQDVDPAFCCVQALTATAAGVLPGCNRKAQTRIG